MMCISSVITLIWVDTVLLSECCTVIAFFRSVTLVFVQVMLERERIWQATKSQMMLMDCTTSDVWVYLDPFLFFFTQSSQYS